jgi:hypothetical protein
MAYVMCRWAPRPTSQLQIFSKTRFSSFSILIESLQLYRPTLEQAVKTPQYATHAAKALKKPPYIPPDDDTPKDLREAEQQMADLETGLFNTRAPPPAAELAGCKKYATIYMNIMSPRFWEALQVRTFLARIAPACSLVVRSAHVVLSSEVVVEHAFSLGSADISIWPWTPAGVPEYQRPHSTRNHCHGIRFCNTRRRCSLMARD